MKTLAEYPQLIAGAATDLAPHRVIFYLRITSYNVCYTKLLRRSSQPLTKSGGKQADGTENDQGGQNKKPAKDEHLQR